MANGTVKNGGRTQGKEASVESKFREKRRLWAQSPNILMNDHVLLEGDARHLKRLIGEREVHLVVTSPPYWNLKQYVEDGSCAQLGHIDPRETFLEELREVWRQCYDHLVPGGRMCVIVGDVCRSRKLHGRHVVEPLHAYIQVQCQEIGFDPLAPIIWHKIANMKTEVAGNGSAFLGKPYEPNAIIKNDIEYILNFRKPGGYRHPTEEQRALSLIEKEDHKTWFRQIWEDVRGEVQKGHPAPFPVEIPRRLIGMYSFIGDVVLDPFVGTGSTTVAAMAMHRSSIGIELEPGYLRIAHDRIGDIHPHGSIEYRTQAAI